MSRVAGLIVFSRTIGFEDRVAPLPERLRRIHRDIGLPKQLLGCVIGGAPDSDADTRLQGFPHAALDRRAQRPRKFASPQPPPPPDRRPPGNGELVATEPRRDVRLPTRARKRSATATSISSPAEWPRLSFTVLKSSRSRKRIETVRGACGLRAPARAAAGSRKSIRFADLQSTHRARPGAPVVPRGFPLRHIAVVAHDSMTSGHQAGSLP